MSGLRVVVLGAGPAGLAAAHAAAGLPGSDVRILSKQGRKSRMNGAQYLHAPIPGMGDPVPFDIDYQLRGGTPAEYAVKVYGAGRVTPEDVSAASLVGVHPGWDIRTAYDSLWACYGPYVRSFDAEPKGLEAILESWKPDLVVSSIPAPLLCADRAKHGFDSETIWSTNKSLISLPDNTVVCNAADAPAWYRASVIHGHGNTEWPTHSKPPFNSSQLWEVVKPIGNNCDCFPEVMRVGRYGNWQKGQLVHTIYQEVIDKCEAVAQRLW